MLFKIFIIIPIVFFDLSHSGGPSFSVVQGPIVEDDDNECPTCQDVYSLSAYANNCFCAYPLGTSLYSIVAIATDVNVTLYGCCFDSLKIDPENKAWIKFEITKV